MNPLTWLRTARRIAAEKPDFLLLQWWTPFWLPLYLVVTFYARRVGIPILYLSHQFLEPDSGLIEWFVARQGLQTGDGYIVLTEEEFVMARRMFRGKSVRIGHLPIFDVVPKQHISRSEARQQLGVDADAPLLLFFGFVRRYKGLHYLIEALSKLSRPVSLLVVGEFWEDEQQYHTQIAKLGLQDRVMIRNAYVPNEEIEPYFAAADALVLPYLSGSQSAVGMMSINYGVPVIATDIGGLAETIVHGETGLIVPSADSDALASAIDSFFEHNQGEKFRAMVKQSQERLSWEALVHVIEEIGYDIQKKNARDI